MEIFGWKCEIDQILQIVSAYLAHASENRMKIWGALESIFAQARWDLAQAKMG